MPDDLFPKGKNLQDIINDLRNADHELQKEIINEVKICQSKLADVITTLGSLELNRDLRENSQQMTSIATPTMAGSSYMISAVDSPSTSTQQSVAMITSSINQSL